MEKRKRLGNAESGREHKVLLDRKWGRIGVQGEVATGGRGPTQSELMSVETKGLIVDPVCEFLGVVGRRKERSGGS
jgi:hypothetical protein